MGASASSSRGGTSSAPRPTHRRPARRRRDEARGAACGRPSGGPMPTAMRETPVFDLVEGEGHPPGGGRRRHYHALAAERRHGEHHRRAGEQRKAGGSGHQQTATMPTTKPTVGPRLQSSTSRRAGASASTRDVAPSTGMYCGSSARAAEDDAEGARRDQQAHQRRGGRVGRHAALAWRRTMPRPPRRRRAPRERDLPRHARGTSCATGKTRTASVYASYTALLGLGGLRPALLASSSAWRRHRSLGAHRSPRPRTGAMVPQGIHHRDQPGNPRRSGAPHPPAPTSALATTLAALAAPRRRRCRRRRPPPPTRPHGRRRPRRRPRSVSSNTRSLSRHVVALPRTRLTPGSFEDEAYVAFRLRQRRPPRRRASRKKSALTGVYYEAINQSITSTTMLAVQIIPAPPESQDVMWHCTQDQSRRRDRARSSSTYIKARPMDGRTIYSLAGSTMRSN